MFDEPTPPVPTPPPAPPSKVKVVKQKEPPAPPRGQPKEMEVPLSIDEWNALTSEDPMSIRELRGRRRLEIREDFPVTHRGPIHSVLKNQMPCPRCASPSFFVIADGVACLGCGTSRSE